MMFKASFNANLLNHVSGSVKSTDNNYLHQTLAKGLLTTNNLRYVCSTAGGKVMPMVSQRLQMLTSWLPGSVVCS
jgi:hypothetical protein